MKYCDQCGKPINDNARFCSVCGTPVAPVITLPKKPVCTNCGELIEDGSQFCPNCGNPHSAAEISKRSPAVFEEPVHTVPAPQSSNIIGYLQRVTALEKSVYLQTQTIQKIKEYISSLGHPQEISKPMHPGQSSESLFKGAGTALTSGTFVVGLIVYGCSEYAFWPSMFLGAFISLGFVLILNFLIRNSDNKERDEKYRRAYAYYTAAVKADEERVESELAELCTLLPIADEMQEKLDKTVKILDQYYTLDIIYPKYRNIVAMCSFCEYFMSRRCDTLIGPQGAYTVFEMEIRLDRICAKLDEVIENLEQIKANQYMLYNAIQEGNRLTEQLLEESIKQSQIAARTEENTALTAHYAKITATNTEALTWIETANYYAIRQYTQ